MTLKSPFPYFGGKSTIAPLIWQRFGGVVNYVEPFCGSAAVLLAGPMDIIRTVNDMDVFISNFWRALQSNPEQVACHADWPVNEADLHARHIWLIGKRESLTDRLISDPEWYDDKIAGWWVWGASCWIGSGWCDGTGAWAVRDGAIVNLRDEDSDAGQGVQRQRPHLSDAGQGVNRKRPHLGDAGQGIQRVANRNNLIEYFAQLSDVLRNVRVCCGDWMRVMGPAVTYGHGLTGVFLDPPYSHDVRDSTLYAVESSDMALDVRNWCIEHGDNPLLRIALCGYDNEGHDELQDHGWSIYRWKAHGGYGNLGNGRGHENAAREVIWFSPACLGEMESLPLFAALEDHHNGEH